MNSQITFYYFSRLGLSLLAPLVSISGQPEGMKAIFQKAENHWAFQPIQDPKIPKSGLHNPIDAFVEQSLREQSLDFAKPANRETMIRRLYHDLLWLKPTYEEIKHFI